MDLQPFENLFGEWFDRPVTMRSLFEPVMTQANDLASFGTKEVATWPKMKYAVTDKEHTYSFDVPGVVQKDLNVKVDSKDRTLTVSGKRHSEETHKDEHNYSKEVYSGSFERTVPLDKTVNLMDKDAVHMVHNNGVLTVTFEKVLTPVEEEHVFNLSFGDK
jgi:HSP20 family molecular chaperone IbpA